MYVSDVVAKLHYFITWGLFSERFLFPDSGVCEYCNKHYKYLRSHHLDKHVDIIREKENIQSIYPQSCPFCGKGLKNRRDKGRHQCFMNSKTKIDYRAAKTSEGKEALNEKISQETDNTSEGIKQETEFICHLCGIHCPSRASLTNHLQMNCGNVCEICKEILSNKSEVKKHMFEVHKKIKTTFHNVSSLQ